MCLSNGNLQHHVVIEEPGLSAGSIALIRGAVCDFLAVALEVFSPLVGENVHRQDHKTG